MNRFAVSALSLLLATSFNLLAQNAPAASPAPGVVADAHAPLQGTWEGTEKGREAAGKCTLKITGKNIDFKGANPAEWYTGTIAVSDTVEPKHLDGTIIDCPAPAMIGKVGLGIYKLEGDTLTLTGRHPGDPERPKSFTDTDKTRTFVLKKVTK